MEIGELIDKLAAVRLTGNERTEAEALVQGLDAGQRRWLEQVAEDGDDEQLAEAREFLSGVHLARVHVDSGEII